MREWTQCVIDASLGCSDGLFCFCPIEGDPHGDFQIVTGMNFLSPISPEGLECVAIIYLDGQDAVDRFCEEHSVALQQIKNRPD